MRDHWVSLPCIFWLSTPVDGDCIWDADFSRWSAVSRLQRDLQVHHQSPSVPPRDREKIRAPLGFFAIYFRRLRAPLRARVQYPMDIHSFAPTVRDGGDDAFCYRNGGGDRIGQKSPYCERYLNSDSFRAQGMGVIAFPPKSFRGRPRLASSIQDICAACC